MPQQLIYTSAPRGLVAGRSGYCTVARSAGMREPLALRLEQLSYYQHLSLSGGKERPLCAYRIIDIRGARFHVLSRIRDAGLDFTGRTNFIAHHLVISPEEIGVLSTPAVIFRDWDGWLASWASDPRMFDNENWSNLSSLTKGQLPARTWQTVTGDAVNACALFENRPPLTLCVDELSEATILALFAEAAELLEIKDPRKDFRVAAWDYTFSTSIQEQDNMGDFRWRCAYSDSPLFARLAGDCRKVSALRSIKATDEEKAFSREGWKAPKFLMQPRDVRIIEGEAAWFEAKVEGLPAPSLQWYAVNRSGQDPQAISGATDIRLVIKNAGRGVTRYVLHARNLVGEQNSPTVSLEVEPKARSESRSASLVQPRLKADSTLRQWEDSSPPESRRFSNASIFLLSLVVIGLATAAIFFYHAKLFGPTITPQITENLSNGVLTLSVNASNRLPLLPFKYRWRHGTNIIGTARSVQVSNVGPHSVDVYNWAAKATTNVNVTDAALGKIPAKPKQSKNETQPLEDNYPLPAGWTNLDVGVTKQRSEYHFNWFNLDAYGMPGAATTQPSMLFVYMTNKGNAPFEAVLKGWNGSNGAAGIMFKEPNNISRFIFVGVSNRNMCCIIDGKSCDNWIPKPQPIRVPTNITFRLTLGINSEVSASYYTGAPRQPFKWTQCSLPIQPTMTNLLVGYSIFPSGANRVTASFSTNPPLK